jgi:hypothetical protein
MEAQRRPKVWVLMETEYVSDDNNSTNLSAHTSFKDAKAAMIAAAQRKKQPDVPYSESWPSDRAVMVNGQFFFEINELVLEA